jgi:hypothetical protein
VRGGQFYQQHVAFVATTNVLWLVTQSVKINWEHSRLTLVPSRQLSGGSSAAPTLTHGDELDLRGSLKRRQRVCLAHAKIKKKREITFAKPSPPPLRSSFLLALLFFKNEKRLRNEEKTFLSNLTQFLANQVWRLFADSFASRFPNFSSFVRACVCVCVCVGLSLLMRSHGHRQIQSPSVTISVTLDWKISATCNIVASDFSLSPPLCLSLPTRNRVQV